MGHGNEKPFIKRPVQAVSGTKFRKGLGISTLKLKIGLFSHQMNQRITGKQVYDEEIQA